MPPTNPLHPLLSDLHPLQLTDQQRFKEAITAGGQKGWYYFFPYLLFVRLGSQSSRMVWTEDQGSICLFKHQYGRNRRLDLVFPPFPYQEGPLRRSLERINDFNQANSSRIYFIDAQDLPQLQALNAFSFSPRNPQYLYAPQELAELNGSRFRTLRRNIKLARRLADIVVEPYRLEHAGQCRQLLQLWERTQGVKHHVPVYQHRYALSAFHFAPQMDDRELHGLVFLVNGQVRAFAFGGEIRKGLGCSLLGIADPAVTSLSYVMGQEQLTRMQECHLYNGGSDAGQSGLRDFKQRFRPCGLHVSYTAKQISRPLFWSISPSFNEQVAGSRLLIREKPAALSCKATPDDKQFLHMLKSVLRAPSSTDWQPAEFDRVFAGTSFPQSFFRLVFVISAAGHKRILVSRSATGKLLPFSKVFWHILRHSRRTALAIDRFQLQMDFLVDHPLSLHCTTVGSFQIPQQDFQLGQHGLVIRGNDNKIHLFLPSDIDLFGIKNVQGLESHLKNKYGLDYIQNAELEYFKTSCFVSENGSWVVWRHDQYPRVKSVMSITHTKGQMFDKSSAAKQTALQGLPPPYPKAKYELRPSRMIEKQVGLFALTEFHAGELVVPDSDFDESRFIPWEEFETLDEITRRKVTQYCYKARDDVRAPRNINTVGICCFINHSCEPALYLSKNGDFIALRDIHVGEELTADLAVFPKKPILNLHVRVIQKIAGE